MDNQRTLPAALKDGIHHSAEWLTDIMPAFGMMCIMLVIIIMIAAMSVGMIAVAVRFCQAVFGG